MGKVEKLQSFMWKDNSWVKTASDFGENDMNSSARFTCSVEDGGRDLCEIFELDGKDFYHNFQKACSGDGDEKKKITTLHSSSLCALLFFHNISKSNPITFDLPVDGVMKQIVFDWVTFEFKNPVIGNPSNMDVVLVSDDEKYVLFLESKFSEYILSASNRSKDISNAYQTEKNKYAKECYEDAFLEKLKIQKKNNEKSEGYFQLLSDENVYLDGLKQMISHFIGVCRRADDHSYWMKSDRDNFEDANVILDAIENGANLYLGEILFDFCNVNSSDEELKKEYQKMMNIYEEKYEILADRLNDLVTEKLKGDASSKVLVLEKDLHYSDLVKGKKHVFSNKVIDYYRLGEL